ncbi:hypothetical protein D039_0909B, partial [Vibrio parahaemolyticus EKP-028]
ITLTSVDCAPFSATV